MSAVTDVFIDTLVAEKHQVYDFDSREFSFQTPDFLAQYESYSQNVLMQADTDYVREIAFIQKSLYAQDTEDQK